MNDANADGNISYTQKTSLETFKGTTQIWLDSLTPKHMPST